MYINEITVKHSAEYFWCQRANKAAFKDVVSSPSTSLLCTSHEVVTQSCLIKIFSPSKSIRFMRSIFILRNNNKHQNHLSDDELNTEKTNSFPRKISRHYKTTQTDESQKFTSIYKQLRVCARPGLLVKSCTETTGLAHAGVKPPRPHIKLCAQCERLPLKGVTPSSSLHDQIASGRCEHETPHRQMYRSDFRDNSATVDSVYRLSSFWFLMLFQDLDLVFLYLQR